MPEVYTKVSVYGVILTVLAVIVLLIFLGSIYALIRAVFLFIFASGEGDKIKKAWSSLRFMIIGILIALIVLIIFPLVFKWAGVPNAQYFSIGNIFKEMKEVIKAILNIGEWMSRFYRGFENTPAPTPGNYTL